MQGVGVITKDREDVMLTLFVRSDDARNEDDAGGSRSRLVDGTQCSTRFDGPAVSYQNLRQNACDGRTNFVSHVIGVNLDQRLVHGDRIARALEPSSER